MTFLERTGVLELLIQRRISELRLHKKMVQKKQLAVFHLVISLVTIRLVIQWEWGFTTKRFL